MSAEVVPFRPRHDQPPFKSVGLAHADIGFVVMLVGAQQYAGITPNGQVCGLFQDWRSAFLHAVEVGAENGGLELFDAAVLHQGDITAIDPPAEAVRVAQTRVGWDVYVTPAEGKWLASYSQGDDRLEALRKARMLAANLGLPFQNDPTGGWPFDGGEAA